MTPSKDQKGLEELRQARRTCRNHFRTVAIFSIFVNLLMLTGPLFMLQVYDRVLSSRSEETLLALFFLVTVLFLFMGLLDYARGRVLARAGARFQSLLDLRVFEAVMRRSLLPGERARPNTAARDLDAVRQLLSGPAPFALFDIPWTPIFIAAIFVFHPLLGFVAIAAGVLLVSLTLLNQWHSQAPQAEATGISAAADNLGETLRQNAEQVQALGMRQRAMARWSGLRSEALDKQIAGSDRTAGYQSASKALRFYLQSLMLAVGAWLVLGEAISAGMMIAASILLGRALAPIEQAIGQWALFQRARSGWRNLGELLAATPVEEERTALPAPKGFVEVKAASVVAPGDRLPLLRGISFKVRPGQALGVIGPSGAGKTTLARLLTGVWPPVAGSVRLDGAALDQWPRDELGSYIGYLPQEIGLMYGTVAENISRFDPNPSDDEIVTAAKRAGAHDLLLSLPEGYDTQIGAGGQRLSGGQRQRIALARALYGDPPVLILDEPNANLDATGEQALVEAIRSAKARERAVIVMAHRPSAIAACDELLMVEAGHQVDLGPRDEVLQRRTRNFRPAAAATGAKGVAGTMPKIVQGGLQPKPRKETP